MFERCVLLSSHPFMGPTRPDLAPGVRHSMVGPYLIVYRPGNDSVEILRFLHGARDIPEVFRE